MEWISRYLNFTQKNRWWFAGAGAASLVMYEAADTAIEAENTISPFGGFFQTIFQILITGVEWIGGLLKLIGNIG